MQTKTLVLTAQAWHGKSRVGAKRKFPDTIKLIFKTQIPTSGRPNLHMRFLIHGQQLHPQLL